MTGPLGAMRRPKAPAVALALALALGMGVHRHGAAEPPYLPDAEALRSVWVYIDHKDCNGAIQALNRGLAEGQPDLLLLAGAMYEEGSCLKANWERAAHMYQRAHEAGHPDGLPRLVSGHAVKGRDPAAALWWAHRGKLGLPEACMGPAAQVDDAERYVAALRAWPPSQLATCVYAAGLIGTLAGDVETPERAIDHGLTGRYRLRVTPVTGAVTWTEVDAQTVQRPGLVDAAIDRDRQESRAIRDAIQAHLERIARRALARYERPPALPSDWSIEVSYEFLRFVR